MPKVTVTLENDELEGKERDVLSPEVEAEVCRRAAKLANGKKPPEDRSKALARVRAEVANLADATAGDALRSSPLIEMNGGRAEFWSTRSPEAALLRVAGTSEQICVVAGGGFVRFRQANLRAVA